MRPENEKRPPELWNLIADEAAGVLSSFERDPGQPEEIVELLGLWQAVARLRPNEERMKVGLGLESALGRLPGPAILRALGQCIQPAGWAADFEAFARTLEGDGDLEPRDEAAISQEAIRLTRLLDRWRLAVLGAKRACSGPPRIFRTAYSEGPPEQTQGGFGRIMDYSDSTKPQDMLWEELEKSAVQGVLERAGLLEDAAPFSLAVLKESRVDLGDTDPALNETLDVHLAIAHAGTVDVDAATARLLLEPFLGRDPARSFDRYLPELRSPLAASMDVRSPPVGFEWRSPDGGVRAVLDVPSDPPNGEETELQLIFLRGGQPAPEVRQARLFGFLIGLDEGRGPLTLGTLRRASSSPFTPTLEVEDASGTWFPWRMVAPEETH